MTCRSEIRRHLDQALGDDPRMAVVGVRRLVEEDLPWLEERAVRFARAEGYSWGKIGRLLGRSRQAVFRRHVRIDGTPQVPPRRPLHNDERFMAVWNQMTADVRRRREFDELAPGDAVPW